MSFEPDKKYHSRHFHLLYALEALKGVEGRVLDVGCGAGGFARVVKRARPDLEIWGVDVERRVIGQAERSLKGLRGLRFKVGDAQELPFGKNEFAAVLTVDVLEHLKRPERAISEAARVLKKEGVFHLVVPLEGELTTFDGWLKKFWGVSWRKKSVGHRQQFTLKEIEKMLKKEMFKINRILFSYHFWYQFFSLGYYLYVTLFRKGEYLPLVSRRRSVNKLILFLTILGGWLVFWESSLLRKVKGQTAHITAVK